MNLQTKYAEGVR